MMSLRHLLDCSGVVRAILEVNLHSLTALRPLGTIRLRCGTTLTVATTVTRLPETLVTMITLPRQGGTVITGGRLRPQETTAIIRPRLSGLLGTTTISG